MAQSDRKIGKNTVVVFLPTGGASPADDITLTGDQTSFQWNENQDTADVTAGADEAGYEVATVRRLEWSLMVFDANQTWLEDLRAGSTGKLTVYKHGIGTGRPVISFNALVKGYSEDMPFDGALEIELSGSRLGDFIDAPGTTQA